MRAIVGLVLVVLLAGCARFGLGPGAGGSQGPLDLAGAWVLQRGSGPAGAIHVPDTYRVTLIFDDEGVHGQACNHYGGTYELDGSAITFSAMSMTEMACEEPMMTVEAAYHAALGEITQVERRGNTLTLRGDGSELVYGYLPPAPDAALEGTRWLLDTMFEGDVASSVRGSGWLVFGPDGALSGSTGCRDVTGHYVVDGDEVVATDLGADGECSADMAAQDGLVLEVLGDGFMVQIDGDRLTLSQPDGNGLGYRAPGED